MDHSSDSSIFGLGDEKFAQEEKEVFVDSANNHLPVCLSISNPKNDDLDDLDVECCLSPESGGPLN